MMFAYPGRGKGGGQRLVYLFWGTTPTSEFFKFVVRYLFQPCLSLKKRRYLRNTKRM